MPQFQELHDIIVPWNFLLLYGHYWSFGLPFVHFFITLLNLQVLLIRFQVFLLHLPQLLYLGYNQSWIPKDFRLLYPQFLKSFHSGNTSLIFSYVISCFKFTLIAKGMWDPSGVIKSIPIPFPYWFMALSKYIFHVSNSTSKMSSSWKSSLPSSPSIGFLAQKFNMTLLLIVFLATYFKSNFVNKINHLDNLPLKVGSSKIYFNGSNGWWWLLNKSKKKGVTTHTSP